PASRRRAMSRRTVRSVTSSRSASSALVHDGRLDNAASRRSRRAEGAGTFPILGAGPGPILSWTRATFLAARVLWEGNESVIDHVFLNVSDMDRSVEFYNQALRPFGMSKLIDFDGSTAPAWVGDLKGFGAGMAFTFWLREGAATAGTHVGFTAPSKD